MAISAFTVQVPSAEPLVRDLRERFDATTKLGVPAHITVLVPFMAPSDITPDVLHRAQKALAAVRSFTFSLNTVGRFSETTYLAIAEPAPFIALTGAVTAGFPGYLPYGGAHESVVPHLTVAHGNADEAAQAEVELRRRLDTRGGVQADCTSVVLVENSTGRWESMHVFALPGSLSASGNLR